MTSQWLNNLKTFFAQPFNSSMNAGHWFLFFGLAMVMFALWRIIFKHIDEGL